MQEIVGRLTPKLRVDADFPLDFPSSLLSSVTPPCKENNGKLGMPGSPPEPGFPMGWDLLGCPRGGSSTPRNPKIYVGKTLGDSRIILIAPLALEYLREKERFPKLRIPIRGSQGKRGNRNNPYLGVGGIRDSQDGSSSWKTPRSRFYPKGINTGSEQEKGEKIQTGREKIP